MPYFDGVHITVIPDPAIQLANLRAGKIDAMCPRQAIIGPPKILKAALLAAAWAGKARRRGMDSIAKSIVRVFQRSYSRLTGTCCNHLGRLKNF